MDRKMSKRARLRTMLLRSAEGLRRERERDRRRERDKRLGLRVGERRRRLLPLRLRRDLPPEI